MECSEILSPIIQTHKIPLQTHNSSPAGFHKKIAKFYEDVTLVEGVSTCGLCRLIHIKESFYIIFG
jgi:hypothetical protein